MALDGIARFGIVLHCIALRGIAFCMRCIAWQGVGLDRIAWYCMVLHCIELRCTHCVAFHGAAWFGTARRGVARRC
eukprot:957290-Lingulodinium_polyedra.AAC.1